MDIIGWLAIAGAVAVAVDIARKLRHRHAVRRRLRAMVA